MLNRRPAIAIVPVREAEPVFCAMLNVTAPFPVPLVPDVIVIQVAVVDAVQLQPSLAVTDTVSVIASGPIARLAGSRLKLHARPAWLMKNVRPAIVNVVDRAEAVVLAATV
jgi:hypothetical protein